MRKFKVSSPVHDALGLAVPRGGVSLLHDKNGLPLNAETKSRKLPPKVIPIPNKVMSFKAYDITKNNIKIAKGVSKSPPCVGYADSLWYTDKVTGAQMKDNNNEVDVDELQGVHEQAPPKKVHPFVIELAKLEQDIKQNIGKLPAENVEKLEEFLTNSPKSPINIIYKRLEASKEKNSVYLNEALNGIVEEISASIQNRKLELGMYPNDEEEHEQEPEEDEYEEDDCDESVDEEPVSEGKELLESFFNVAKTASGGTFFILKNGLIENVVWNKDQLALELSSYESIDDIVVLKKVNISYGVIVDG
jgi:hypothetical protein